MTLHEILHSIQLITSALKEVKTMTIEEYNLFLERANMDLFDQIYGFIKLPGGNEASQRVKDSLAPFRTDATINLTVGSGSLPANYFHATGCLYNDGTKNREVDIVTDQEWVYRQSDSLSNPTVKYPIARTKTGNILVNPTSIASVTLYYYKYPTTPVYAQQESNGIMVYDAGSSTELEWEEDRHDDIIRLICGYLGLSVGRPDIVQYTEMKQQQEI